MESHAGSPCTSEVRNVVNLCDELLSACYRLEMFDVNASRSSLTQQMSLEQMAGSAVRCHCCVCVHSNENSFF